MKWFDYSRMTTYTKQTRWRRVVMFVPMEVHTGGERYLKEVFTYLQRQGVAVEPIYLEHTTQERSGIALIIDCLLANLRFYYQARQLGDLTNVVFFEDFHLHPRLWLFNLLVHLTSGRLKTVVLVQLDLFYHTALSHRWARWLDERVVRIFLQQSSLILTNSEFTRQKVLSLGINPRKVTSVYCGYDGGLSIRSAESSASGKSQQRILFVGQCAEYKGIEFLLRAMPMISGQVALDIVGDTTAELDYFIKLQHVVTALGLESQVTFHGHVSDKAMLAQFYQRANVFVLPSLVEGFGIVLLDAMSFGLPIVATWVGAIPELVQDGVNGLLVPPADPATLAAAIDKLLASPELRRKYGENGLRFVQQHGDFYSWEAVGERVLGVLEPLLSEQVFSVL